MASPLAGGASLGTLASTDSLTSDDGLRPTPMSSKEMETRRQKAIRKFRTGWVVDADDRPETALALDATRQGLKAMYSMGKSLAREKLRLNAALLRPMKRLWRAALTLNAAALAAMAAGEAADNVETPETRTKRPGVRVTHEHVVWARQRPLNAKDTINKEGYVQFVARVFRAMHHPINAKIDSRRYNAMPGEKLRRTNVPRKPFELTATTRAAIEDDWEQDTQGASHMTYGMFHDATFEVADMWTSYETIDYYVLCLNMLWVCVTIDGLRPRPLAKIPGYNEVTYGKTEGEIRGPATLTQAMNPVSVEGESNWFTVSLPSTFFPPKEEVEAAKRAAYVPPPRPKRIFSAGIGRRRFVDEHGMAIATPSAGGGTIPGVQLVLKSDMRRHLEDAFVMEAPGPRSAYFIADAEGRQLAEEAGLDLGGWDAQVWVDGPREAGRTWTRPVLTTAFRAGPTPAGVTETESALLGYLDRDGVLVQDATRHPDPTSLTPLLVDSKALLSVTGTSVKPPRTAPSPELPPPRPAQPSATPSQYTSLRIRTDSEDIITPIASPIGTPVGALSVVGQSPDPKARLASSGAARKRPLRSPGRTVPPEIRKQFVSMIQKQYPPAVLSQSVEAALDPLAATGSAVPRPKPRRRRRVKPPKEEPPPPPEAEVSPPKLPVLRSPIKVVRPRVETPEPVLISPSAALREHLRQVWTDAVGDRKPTPAGGRRRHTSPPQASLTKLGSTGGSFGGWGVVSPQTSTTGTPTKTRKARTREHPLLTSPAAEKWTKRQGDIWSRTAEGRGVASRLQTSKT